MPTAGKGTYRELLRQGEHLLRRRVHPAPCDDAATDAFLLLEKVSGLNRTNYPLKKDEHYPQAEREEYLALLRRQVDLLLAVKQYAVAEHDAPAVGRHDAGDALERHALAAAGDPEQRQRFVRYLEFRLQTERAKAFFNINIQAHAFALLARLAPRRRSRRSSILTASSTTVEMAILTMTHFVARASLFVCQS